MGEYECSIIVTDALGNSTEIKETGRTKMHTWEIYTYTTSTVWRTYATGRNWKWHNLEQRGEGLVLAKYDSATGTWSQWGSYIYKFSKMNTWKTFPSNMYYIYSDGSMPKNMALYSYPDGLGWYEHTSKSETIYNPNTSTGQFVRDTSNERYENKSIIDDKMYIYLGLK